jgi:hypothetical protein
MEKARSNPGLFIYGAVMAGRRPGHPRKREKTLIGADTPPVDARIKSGHDGLIFIGHILYGE